VHSEHELLVNHIVALLVVDIAQVLQELAPLRQLRVRVLDPHQHTTHVHTVSAVVEE
jgi:hypothetical protein